MISGQLTRGMKIYGYGPQICGCVWRSLAKGRRSAQFQSVSSTQISEHSLIYRMYSHIKMCGAGQNYRSIGKTQKWKEGGKINKRKINKCKVNKLINDHGG